MSAEPSRDSAAPALWILAVAAVTAGLYFFRETLTQFAIALILWLLIDGLATWLDKRIPLMPRALALPIAILLVLGGVSGVVWVIASNIGALAGNADAYESRLNEIIALAYAALGGQGPAPTLGEAISRAGPERLIGLIGAGVQNIISNFIFVLIFLAFLFPAAAMLPRKLTAIFPRKDSRRRAAEILDSIRQSIDRYLFVQTLMSLIITALTFVTLTLIGLDNAIFWSFLIFFLNYIPTIGSLVAVVLPTAFALVQFPDLARVAMVAGGVGLWQFVIGNFVQPRMTGESLNLTAVGVLLALAVWGSIWGVAGAFLAAPLTVMIMIICAQFPSTHWIAVLLSANARPAVVGDGRAPAGGEQP